MRALPDLARAGSRRRRFRRAGMALAALCALAGPYVLGVAPAFGDRAPRSLSATATRDLTFVTDGGTTATCRLSARFTSTVPTDQLFANQESLRPDGTSVPECFGFHVLDLYYRNQFGDLRHSIALTAETSDFLSIADIIRERDETADFAFAVHRVTLTDCDAAASSTCSLQVATAPK